MATIPTLLEPPEPNYGVKTYGFERKLYTTILEEKKQLARLLLGEDTFLDEGSQLLLLLELISFEEARLWGVIEDSYFGGFVQTATGRQLTSLAELVGISRISAKHASGNLTVTANSGTYIPATTLFSTSDGRLYLTTRAVTYVVTGSMFVEVRAVFAGPSGNVGSGEIVNIVNPIVGVSTVTNAVSFNNGQEAETDAVLRVRLQQTFKNRYGTVEGIRGALLELEGISAVEVVENTGTHSAALYIYDKTPPNQDIDDIVSNWRPVGISITWAGVTTVPIYVSLDVEFEDGYDGYEGTLKQSIVDYIMGLAPGDDVDYESVIGAAWSAGHIIKINAVKIDTVSPPAGVIDIVIASGNKATCQLADIDVTLL